MAADLSPDEIEDDVLTWLSMQEVDVLEQVCTKLTLTCPEEKKGKKTTVLKLILKHLCDLETTEDQGMSTFLLLHGLIDTEDKKDGDDKKGIIKHPVGDTTKKKGSEVTFDILKLKDFKISGSIGGVGEKDKLSYTSLCYQIVNAQKSGYSNENVCAAVVKAISPGNNLRTYLESKPNLNLDSLLNVLRSHFKEKDSSAVFTELGNAVQQAAETTLEFVIRLMCMRQKVLDLSQVEGCPYDGNLLKKRFFHTMFTGLRNANIRVDLREQCQNNPLISDEDLLKFVSEVVANETERNEKLSTKKSVDVNVVDNKNSKDKKKENPFVQIQELQLTHQKEMAAMRTEISEIKNTLLAAKPSLQNQPTNSRFDGNVQNFTPSYRRNMQGNFTKKKNKCRKCELDNVPRCFHCFVCGSVEHMSFNCPSRAQKNF